MTDFSFRAMGPETLAFTWPVFVLFAGAQAAFVRFVKRNGPPSRVWIIAGVATPAAACIAMWFAFERAAQAELASQGLPPLSMSPIEWLLELLPISAGPLLWTFCLAQLALLIRPRSNAVVVGLTVVSGVALSWVLAIWLYLKAHGAAVGFLVLPGGLGVSAALPGFVASGAMWAGGVRWWHWRDRNRRAV